MALDKLIVRGAREHNLKNIDLEIPRDQLVVITGLSGSGKSSLAFDTIYAEGQRRYVESLSAYARQFLGLMEKPNVDQIEGLSPAISIDQKGSGRNPRSTVGTVTEVYDYLRLLYARIGQPHCPNCGEPITMQTPTQIVDLIMEMAEGSRLLILAPIIKDRKGNHKGVFTEMQKQGYVRARINGEIYEVDSAPDLDRYKNHTIEAVIDRIVVHQPQANEENPDEGPIGTDLTRLSDSVETALRLGEGAIIVSDVTDRDNPVDRTFSEHFSCVKCGTSIPEIEPRTFSFNSPHGACPSCHGLGTLQEFDPELILDDSLSLSNGAVRPWKRQNESDGDGYYTQLLSSVSKQFAIPFDQPVGDLSLKQRDVILYGPPAKRRPGANRVQKRPRRVAPLRHDLQRGDIESAASVQRDDQRLHPQQVGRVHEHPPMPGLRRQTTAACGAGRHHRGHEYLRPDRDGRQRCPVLGRMVAGRGSLPRQFGPEPIRGSLGRQRQQWGTERKHQRNPGIGEYWNRP